MESLEEENIIKDIRNLFLKKKDKITLQSIRNRFRLGKETKAIKEILRDTKIIFEGEKEEENNYKPVTKYNFWSNNYTEHESNSDKNKTLSVEEYLTKISLLI